MHTGLNKLIVCLFSDIIVSSQERDMLCVFQFIIVEAIDTQIIISSIGILVRNCACNRKI